MGYKKKWCALGGIDRHATLRGLRSKSSGYKSSSPLRSAVISFRQPQSPESGMSRTWRPFDWTSPTRLFTRETSFIHPSPCGTLGQHTAPKPSATYTTKRQPLSTLPLPDTKQSAMPHIASWPTGMLFQSTRATPWQH